MRSRVGTHCPSGRNIRVFSLGYTSVGDTLSRHAVIIIETGIFADVFRSMLGRSSSWWGCDRPLIEGSQRPRRPRPHRQPQQHRGRPQKHQGRPQRRNQRPQHKITHLVMITQVHYDGWAFGWESSVLEFHSQLGFSCDAKTGVFPRKLAAAFAWLSILFACASIFESKLFWVPRKSSKKENAWVKLANAPRASIHGCLPLKHYFSNWVLEKDIKDSVLKSMSNANIVLNHIHFFDSFN